MTINNKIHVTQEGLDEIKRELEQLQSVKQPAAIERVARAREFGDLSENSEYHSAREDLSFIQGRIDELEEIIKKAQIVKKSNSTKQVAIGCKVTVSQNGQELTYSIVGEWEANPIEKKISHTSPLGQALVGKKPGDAVEFEAPAGKVIYKIKKIH